ncbi:MAG: hypothetical protein PHH37_13340 [Paludibacter sp.]|nr:hypothetical protein [Paludibacter sp.]
MRQNNDPVIPDREARVIDILISDTLVEIKKHQFSVVYYLSGCEVFKEYQTTETDSSSLYKIFVYNPEYYNKEVGCATVLYQDTLNLEFYPHKTGEYTVYFNDSLLTKKTKIIEQPELK